MLDLVQKPVLLLEPDVFWQEILKRHLDKAGIVLCAYNEPVKALESASKIDYNLVILELRFPRLDFFSIIRKFRNHPHLSCSPIIALTGDKRREVLETCLNHGFCDYLIKSDITIPQIVDRISKYF